MKIISLFTGCGGLDLGFKKAGFKIIWANENDKNIVPTFKKNFPNVILDTRSIKDIDPSETPDCDGIIGGPPCQSWSEAGSHRGINDDRGRLFFDYVRFIKEKRPKFFLAENVPGILFNRNSSALNDIFKNFLNVGYNVSFKLLDANNYGVPQTRKRVIIVGYASSFDTFFYPPKQDSYKPNLKDSIYHLKDNAVSARSKNKPNPNTKIPNHEYMIGNFSYVYMSRNRVRKWDEPSFTIQAGGRHAPCHPQAPVMKKIETNKRKFVHGKKNLYRRLTIRECAAIQTFPDNFIFDYSQVAQGYKMVGNAVPVEFARKLALKIKEDLKKLNNSSVNFSEKGTLLNLNNSQLELNIE